VNPENTKEERKMEDKIISGMIREAFPHLTSQFASTLNHVVRAIESQQCGQTAREANGSKEENP